MAAGAGETARIGGQVRAGQPKKPDPKPSPKKEKSDESPAEAKPLYKPEFAYPTELLPNLTKLRGVHPLYGMFLVNQLGIGLHSYGFTEGVLTICGWFVFSQLVLIGVGSMPLKYWSSYRAHPTAEMAAGGS